jgi:large subunit ribosomal protein L6
MSKIGKQPVTIPAGVKVEVEGHSITVTGPKGSIKRHFPPEIEVKVEGAEAKVSAKGSGKFVSALFGTTRALLANDVTGVTTGWSKQLELVGTGFKNKGPRWNYL